MYSRYNSSALCLSACCNNEINKLKLYSWYSLIDKSNKPLASCICSFGRADSISFRATVKTSQSWEEGFDNNFFKVISAPCNNIYCAKANPVSLFGNSSSSIKSNNKLDSESYTLSHSLYLAGPSQKKSSLIFSPSSFSFKDADKT